MALAMDLSRRFARLTVLPAVAIGLALLGSAASTLAADSAVVAPKPLDQKRIVELIKQLGAENYFDREKAQAELTAWVPYYIDHLPDGEHTITLELLGPNGQPAPGPFNRGEQRITVSRAPAPAAAPATPADPHAGH